MALVRTDGTVEPIASIISVTRIGELGITLAVTNNRRMFLLNVRRLLVTVNEVPSSQILVSLMMESLCSFKTSVSTTVTRRDIPENDILHSRCRENPKPYIALTGWTL
jgi:hypothetical protein